VGRAEFLDWMAYFMIQQEEEEKAIEQAKRKAR